jgi:hypothetical protein
VDPEKKGKQKGGSRTSSPKVIITVDDKTTDDPVKLNGNSSQPRRTRIWDLPLNG